MMLVFILSVGTMAGIYFTFSVVIMKSLANVSAPEAARVMNEINDTIVNTIFLPLFFGSTLLGIVLIAASVMPWQSERSVFVLSGASIYIVGMFLVTAFGNVPLNNRLKTSEENEKQLVVVWKEYLQRWTYLNHIRTVSCMLAFLLMCIAYSK